MNTTHGFHNWPQLFRMLMKTNTLAPLIIVAEYLSLVIGVDTSWLTPSVTQSLGWVGELMADAELDEILDAAKSTGLFSLGLNDFVALALTHRIGQGSIQELLSDKFLAPMLMPGLRACCEAYVNVP